MFSNCCFAAGSIVFGLKKVTILSLIFSIKVFYQTVWEAEVGQIKMLDGKNTAIDYRGRAYGLVAVVSGRVQIASWGVPGLREPAAVLSLDDELAARGKSRFTNFFID